MNPEGDIVYGLGAIKGLGEGPIDAIVSARADGGEFKDLFDFCRRIDLKKINRRSLEAMVRAGVLDKLGPKSSFHDRAQLLATLPDAIAAADQDARNEAAGIMDMFGAVDDSPATAVEWKPARAWNDETRLNGERDTLGLFLTGQPLLLQILKFASAGYMIWLAVQSWNSVGGGDADRHQFHFRQGVIVHPLNPKAWVMVLLAWTQFAPELGDGMIQLLLVPVTFAAVQLVCHTAWCAAGAFMQRATPQQQLLTRALILLTIGVVVWALLQ